MVGVQHAYRRRVPMGADDACLHVHAFDVDVLRRRLCGSQGLRTHELAFHHHHIHHHHLTKEQRMNIQDYFKHDHMEEEERSRMEEHQRRIMEAVDIPR